MWLQLAHALAEHLPIYWPRSDRKRDRKQGGGRWVLLRTLDTMHQRRDLYDAFCSGGCGSLGAPAILAVHVGPRSNPNGPWLTRGWKAPYGTNYARAKDALQLPHTPNGVGRVQPRLFEPVAGLRTVAGNPTFGSGGGTEYFRGWSFPN